MLYVTTLDSRNTVSADCVLSEDLPIDGGLYIPFQLPLIDAQQLKSFASCGCCETIAYILNLFFSHRITAWDVQMCIGRDPVKFKNLDRKTVVADVWGNPGGSYEYAVVSLNEKLLGCTNAGVCSWPSIAIAVSFAFGIYAELRKNGILNGGTAYDVCVPEEDLNQLVAFLYARKMGLPVDRIIICSRTGSVLWSFVNHGQLNITQISLSNRRSVQRLIGIALGNDFVHEYVNACQQECVYTLAQEQQAAVASVLFSAVIGDVRIGSVADNVCIPIAPDAAICYAGLQDYRSKTGQGRLALVIGYTAPDKIINP